MSFTWKRCALCAQKAESRFTTFFLTGSGSGLGSGSVSKKPININREYWSPGSHYLLALV